MWLSGISSVLALFIGLITGLCRVSKNFTLRWLATIYVEFIRGTPLLVQIFIAYFFVGTVFNLDRNVAGLGALSILPEPMWPKWCGPVFRPSRPGRWRPPDPWG